MKRIRLCRTLSALALLLLCVTAFIGSGLVVAEQGTAAPWRVAHPPDPSPVPQIVNEPCPWQDHSNAGCFYEHGVDGASAAVIYVDPAAEGTVTDHELGHAYSALHVDAGNRSAIEKSAGWSVWHEETFAWLYAACRDGDPPPDSRWTASNYGGLRGAHTIRRTCAIITRSRWR